MCDMKIKVGDVLWIPRTGQQQVKKPCPVCFGDLSVVVILGDGSQIETPCDYCGKGYEGPRGTVSVYTRDPCAEMFIVATIRTNTTAAGDESEYTTGSGCYAKADNLYLTEQEAVLASEKLREKQLKDDEQRAESIKKDVHKSFSWNVGYHLRQAKDEKRRLEYHERMAVLCKERVPKKKTKPNEGA